jgi:hypothetical protein
VALRAFALMAFNWLAELFQSCRIKRLQAMNRKGPSGRIAGMINIKVTQWVQKELKGFL